jgi:hypothetical protein
MIAYCNRLNLNAHDREVFANSVKKTLQVLFLKCGNIVSKHDAIQLMVNICVNEMLFLLALLAKVAMMP